MEEVKIRSGTRVKLKHVNEDVLPQKFVSQMKDFAHKDERILAVYFFSIQVGDQEGPTTLRMTEVRPRRVRSSESGTLVG